jgi:hypothetical protein
MAPVLALIIILIVLFLLRRLFRRRPSSKNSIKGVVRHYIASTETLPKYNALRNSSTALTVQVLRFVLERFDENGNAHPLIAVEMKGQRISGFISEGHEVEIFDHVRPGQLVTPAQIYNHTANTFVRVVQN